jgi:hypothetical protein
MIERFKPLLDRTFLKAEFFHEFENYARSGADDQLRDRLIAWSARTITGETAIEAAFIGRFFEDTWGYRADGAGAAQFTLRQQFGIAGAGANGAAGSADLALGLFGAAGTEVPQVLCEFKGVGAGLDKPQARKGNRRSPVTQALDYLRFCRRGLFDSAAVLPRFAIVTDMNEFRLYWHDRAPEQFLQFRIAGDAQLFDATHVNLVDTTDASRFDRFLFWRLFRPDMLLSEFGRARLERLVERQGASQSRLENQFYGEYRSYRLKLYNVIKLQDIGDVTDRERLRLAQKILDRFIFVMFAEDMGNQVAFPPHLLRDQLKLASLDKFYESEETDIWDRQLKRLFRTMNDGGTLGDDIIHRFNGGLFEADPLVDRLLLPNHLFCTRGQGRNDATVAADKQTLFYLSATYNFAAEGDVRNSIGLYTLGHIFEQSIVELEALEAEAEGRPSLTEITKRKRDGVYYTPEPIVRRIVEETIDPLFARWRAEAGWPEHTDPTPAAVEAYWQRLTAITIVDPACGSGAFLITALRYLLAEFGDVADLRHRLRLDLVRIDDAQLTRMILQRNLYGVDINPLSVEITQLSLWLHTARAREPLSSFAHTIRCGNSLVDDRLYQRFDAMNLLAEARERIAVFDWRASFPEIFGAGGFDAVIGNPPYVKLQHFRRPYPETARYLREGVGRELAYHSTQTGNYDLFLPFIEKGISLLNDGGRLGYIAPNLWPRLENGEALRRLMLAGRHLERWIDFRSHQVFEEATVYTAIQIFTKAPNDRFLLSLLPDGDLGKVDWTDTGNAIAYADLPADGGEWLIAPAPVLALTRRLAATCRRLDDTGVTTAIFQGLVTSADYVFHLKKLARGRYLHTPRKIGTVQPAPYEVAIEDAIMKPLVSGAHAKRFIKPITDTFILFPYNLADKANLWTPAEMAAHFPGAWAYLVGFEVELRRREKFQAPVDGIIGPFDDDGWYRFGRNQNLEKQELSKLFVAQTVPGMRVFFDATGEFYANNVRVNGIVPVEGGWFLLGILNAPTVNLVFRWTGKPKDGNWFEANRQFIAPLPIPHADAADRAEVGRIARELQTGYTERLRLRTAIADRLGRVSRQPRPHEWLLPDEVRPKEKLEVVDAWVPVNERRAAAATLYKELVDAALARLDDAIRLDSTFDADFIDGELRFHIDDAPAIRGIYLDAPAGEFILAQWLVVALGYEPTGRGDAKRLTDLLRTVGVDAEAEVRSQIIERQRQLASLGATLRALEQQLHDITCTLFELTPAERRLVEAR